MGDVRRPACVVDALPVKASACVECGACVARCPFDVDIMAKLEEAVQLFETPAG